MKTLNEMFREVILKNELSGNEKIALRFSDPDGERSGKSGWSFGVSQFDTQNNGEAINCLVDCGFTDAEIKGIVKQNISVAPLAARLIAHADIVAKYDEAQLSHCINSALNVVTAYGVPVVNPGGILALADYVNQYGSIGDGFVTWMKSVGRPIMELDVLTFKLEHTKYGKEHRDDCIRRYNTIQVMVSNTGAA